MKKKNIIFLLLISFSITGMLFISGIQKLTTKHEPEPIINHEKTKVKKVKNLNIRGIPHDDEFKNEVKNKINQAIRLNDEKNSDKKIIGEVRRSSKKEEFNKETKQTKGEFIIDLPEIEQSYKIIYMLHKNKIEYILFECLKDEEKIYSQGSCENLWL